MTSTLDAVLPLPRQAPPLAEVDPWAAALQTVLADPAQPRLVYQPIVDLTRGVVAGYESLARFDGPVQATPDVWFREAGRLGCAEELEARVLRRAIEVLPTVPVPCFLTVNLTPTLLGAAPVLDAFAQAPSLAGLVVEMTEHVQYEMTPALLATLDRLRAAGAMIAVDDAGSGYAGLGQLLGLRPQLVKLDRALVDHVDTDPGKAATVRLLGDLAGQLDAWILAEGVERVEELEACMAMGVPLGQGWLFGRPAPGWSELPAELSTLIRRTAMRLAATDRLDALASAGSPLAEGERPGWRDPARVQLDERGCPVGVLLPRRRDDDPRGHRAVVAPLLVSGATPVAAAAQRAMSRPAGSRFDPLVCIDDTGRYVGLVPVEVLVQFLTREKDPS